MHQYFFLQPFTVDTTGEGAGVRPLLKFLFPLYSVGGCADRMGEARGVLLLNHWVYG